MFGAADTKSSVAGRVATTFADVPLMLRKISGCARVVLRRAAFATIFAGAALFFGIGVGATAAKAQLFKNGPFGSDSGREKAASSRSVPQPSAQSERSALFSGKYVRSLVDATSGVSKSNSAARNNGSVGRAATRPQGSYPSGTVASTQVAPRSSTVSGSVVSNRSASLANPSESLDSLTQASTSRESSREAAAKIPWESLSSQARQKARELVSNPTIYRRLPMAGGRCNPELFDYFLGNPHAVVAFWNEMGFDDLTMTRRSPDLYEIREKGGTVGSVQILYQDSETTLAYCFGKYRGPVIPRSLEGEMLLLLQTRYTEDEANRPIVVCRLDAFVDLKNPGADLIARTISGPLGKIADANFAQTVAFVDSVSQTAETAPNETVASVANLTTLSPNEKAILTAKAIECARQARFRTEGASVEYRLTPKKNQPTETFARILSREKYGANRASASARTPSNAPSGATGFATSNARFGAPVSTPTVGNSFDIEKPSLAKNSFALSNDLGTTNAPSKVELDDEFELSLDWSEAESLDSAPPIVDATSETSLAKVGSRPASRYSTALNLLEEDGLNAVEKSPFVAPDESFRLSTDEEIDALAVDESFDFGEADATEIEASVAIPLETDALRTSVAPQTTGLPAAPSFAKTKRLAPLPPTLKPRAAEATEVEAETPVLLLPNFTDDDFDAETALENGSEAAVEAEPPSSAPLSLADAASPSESFGGWRAVKSDARNSAPGAPKAVAAVPSAKGRVAKAARVEESDDSDSKEKRGVAFRKPQFK